MTLPSLPYLEWSTSYGGKSWNLSEMLQLSQMHCTLLERREEERRTIAIIILTSFNTDMSW